MTDEVVCNFTGNRLGQIPKPLRLLASGRFGEAERWLSRPGQSTVVTKATEGADCIICSSTTGQVYTQATHTRK